MITHLIVCPFGSPNISRLMGFVEVAWVMRVEGTNGFVAINGFVDGMYLVGGMVSA